MFKDVLTYALPILGWWLLTGIINLAFAYKSQIEAWAESNPRLASLLKLTRALGFDPWNLLSSLKLLASKKLPDAQKSDSPIARLEQRKADEKALGPKDPPPGGGGTRERISFEDPERSRLDNEPPSSMRLSSLVAIGFMLLLVAACSSLPISDKRCAFSNPEYSAHVALCRRQIEAECLLNPDETPVESCAALQRCNAWRKEQCQ